MDTRQVVVEENYLLACNNPALGFNLIVDGKYFASVNESYHAKYVEPVASYLALATTKSLFNIELLSVLFDEIDLHAVQRDFSRIIKISVKLLKLQKVVLEIIEKPDLKNEIINNNEVLKKDLYLLDIGKLEALSVNEFADLKDTNLEVYRLLKTWVRVLAPFHPDLEDTLDEENQKARDLLQKLRISSYPQLAKLADQLPMFYNKDYFIFESLSILSKPATEAVVYFKRFFLNIELVRLGLLKLIDFASEGALINQGSFKKELSLVDQLVTLKFDFLVAHGRTEVEYGYGLDSYLQRQLVYVILNPLLLNKQLTKALQLPGAPAGKFGMWVEIADRFIPARKMCTEMINRLHDFSSLNNWTDVSRLNYAIDLISDLPELIHADGLKKVLQALAPDTLTKLTEFEAICILWDMIAEAVNCCSQGKAISNHLLIQLDLSFNNNMYQVNSPAEKKDNSREMINKVGVCDYLNALRSSRQNDQAIVILGGKIKNVSHALDYCADIAKQNNRHREILLDLRASIYVAPKPVVVKKKSKTAVPKAISVPVPSEEEQAACAAKTLKETVKQIPIVLAEIVSVKSKAENILNNLPEDEKVDQIKLLLATKVEYLNYLAGFEPAVYKNDLMIATKLLHDIRDLLPRFQPIINDFKNYEADLKQRFDVIQREIKLNIEEPQKILVKVKSKLEALNAHAMKRKGVTEKKIYPGFEEIIEKLIVSEQSILVAMSLKEYTPKNMATVIQAKTDLGSMTSQLITLTAGMKMAADSFGVVANGLFAAVSPSSATSNGVSSPVNRAGRVRG